MTKKLLAKVGNYTNRNNEQKNEYVTLGILKEGQSGGEFLLLDPSVNLAGVLMKQNKLAAETGGQQRDMVMVGVFDNQQTTQQNQQQGFNQIQSQHKPAGGNQIQVQSGYQGGFQQQPNPDNYNQGQ